MKWDQSEPNRERWVETIEPDECPRCCGVQHLELLWDVKDKGMAEKSALKQGWHLVLMPCQGRKTPPATQAGGVVSFIDT